MPENAEAANIFMLTKNQVITAGMGSVIDINIQAVKIMMDLYEIRNQRDCMDKVRTLFHLTREKE